MDRSKLTPASNARLDEAMAATKSDRGFLFGRKADFQELIDAGFVAINETIRDGKGVNVKYAIKVVPAALGLDENQTAENQTAPTGGAPTTTADAAKPKSSFVIRDDVPLNPINRPRGGIGGERDSKYPFDELKINDGAEFGQSFHVAKSAEMPDPAKTMASSVSAAKRRWSEPMEGQHRNRKGTYSDNYRMTRNFVMREVKGKTAENPNGDPDGDGVRIFRYKLPDNPVFNKDTYKGEDAPATPPAAPPAA